MGIGQTTPRIYDTGWYIDYDKPVQVNSNVKVIDYTKIDDDSSFFTYRVNLGD